MDHLALLEGEVVAMAAALRAADPARDVPSCPGWTVQDLTNHITAVHRWVLGALRDEGSPPYDETPASPDEYAATATELVTRLRELPADAPCWTFDKDDRTAGFWRRRQLQEVSIHRWDVDRHEIDGAIAQAGVDEVVGFFLPRQLALGRTAVPEGGLTLVAPGKEWALLPGDPVAAVHASTADLNLLLWGRRTLDDVVVKGDAAFAAAVFAAALTP